MRQDWCGIGRTKCEQVFGAGFWVPDLWMFDGNLWRGSGDPWTVNELPWRSCRCVVER